MTPTPPDASSFRTTVCHTHAHHRAGGGRRRAADDEDEAERDKWKRKLDVEVLTPAVQTVGEAIQARFRGRLEKMLPDAKTIKRFPADLINGSCLELAGEAPRMLIAVAPVKGLQRMQVKVRGKADGKKPDGEGDAWPHVQNLGDVLRATVVCGTAEHLMQAWSAIEEEFNVKKTGRLKANWKATSRPPDMLVNVHVEFPGFMPLVGEIQIHYRPILVLKESVYHLFYEITRAKRCSELVPQPPTAAAAAANGATRR